MMGIAGVTWCQRKEALGSDQPCNHLVLRKWDSRVDKEENGGYDHDNASPDINWTVASILHATTPPEYRVALKILVVFAEDAFLRFGMLTRLASVDRRSCV